MFVLEKTKNAYQQFLKLEPLLHLFIWSAVLFYPYVKYAGREGGYMMSFMHELNALFFKMTISYFLYLWFFPRKNKLKNMPIVLIAFVVNILLYEYFDRFFHTDKTGYLVYVLTNLLTNIGFGIVFFALFSLKNIYKKQLEIDSLSHEKQQAELNALKAQVNPHFLFNTLNTVYAHALKKDDKTPELILKLSDSFRYLLHEGQNESVTIIQEVQHLQDYIHLQEERLAKKVSVDFSSTINDEKQIIAPLLLIGFVENAFKYTSILKGNGHPINIQVNLIDNELTFRCDNPFKEANKDELDATWKTSGIGLEANKKRLAMLYPNRHTLDIQQAQEQFSVTLKIQL